MSQEYSRKLEDTDIEVGAQDPLHEEPAITRASYGPIDHLSHVTGIAVSTFYLVAAVATLYEVISRYLFNAPTYWAFETVMMLCATAWMLSSGYITLKKRHIGITVLHVMASERQRWWLDLFAMIVGVIALYMLLSDGSIRAYDSIARIEKSGSAFNPPLPMILKSLMVAGAFLYLSQLLVNLHRHFENGLARLAVKALAVYMVVYFVAAFLGHALDISPAAALSHYFSNIGASLDPSKALNLRSYDLGTISIIMVVLLIALMMTGMPLGIVT
ncbi:MAG: TRAP transporter small permease, partial [Rhodobiaceae bacterium]|nr:TRAP transporter small permease [Rhodobiaceae bacterium]